MCMGNVLQADGNRVDRGAQLMLARLRGEGWSYAKDLRKIADFGENTQVFYRMERYLMPAGLVEERKRDDEDKARQFRLTEEGSVWLDEHSEEIAMPATREEMRELAREGYEAGTSAKESVQKYRKKVSRIKNRVDDVEEEVEGITSEQESNDTMLTIFSERTKDNRTRSQENKKTVTALQEEMETRATSDDLEQLSDDVRSIEETLSIIDGKLAGVTRQQAASERTRTKLERLAKPAGYLVGGSLASYLVVLAVTIIKAPELVVGVVLAGVGALLGMSIGVGLTIYTQGGNAIATYRTITDLPSSDTDRPVKSE